MTGIVLTLRETPRLAIDLAGIVPDRLAGLDLGAIARLAVPAGGRLEPLAELFAVAAGPADTVELATGSPLLDGVGAGLVAGQVRVQGSCGAWAGRGMTGGRLEIAGDAGPWLAAELAGGQVAVAGNAADHVGGARPGQRRGMAGGLVLIRGSAGARAGERQRGGLIIVEGDAGPACAAAMLAGTVAIGGAVGAGAGLAMRRGTILARGHLAAPAPGMADAGAVDLIFLRLLRRRLAALGVDSWVSRLATNAARRLVGDRLLGGQGEILLLEG